MNNFHYISVLLDMLYGIEMEDQDLEELGLLAWGKIGNRNIKLYRVQLCIDPTDNSVTLPCNASFDNTGKNCVELVTSTYEDWERDTNYSVYGDQTTSWVESNIEAQKFYQSQFYLPGKVLKYEQVGDKLYFTHNYGVVNVLYKGVLADEEGLPELTDKEATAIATYIAYITKFKEGLITNNGDIMRLSQILEQKWLKECDQARVQYLSQNAMNNILDAKTNWNRNCYAKGGFKPIP